MGKKTISAIICCAFALLPMAATGQNLSTEVTVERQIIPELREVNKLDFTPNFTIQKPKSSNIKYSFTGITSKIPSDVTVLDPIAYGDTTEITPWKGYISAGFFPLLFNSSISAGYRISDTEKTHFGAWLQYDGTTYRRAIGNTISELIDVDGNIFPVISIDPNQKNIFRRHTFTIGAGLLQFVGNNSSLAVNADYTYSHYNRFGLQLNGNLGSMTQSLALENQGVNRGNLGLKWLTTFTSAKLGLTADVSRFAFINHGIADIPARETTWGIGAFGEKTLGTTSSVAIDVKYSMVRNNRSQSDLSKEVLNFNPSIGDNSLGTNPVPILLSDPINPTLLRLTPAYIYNSSNIFVRLGAKLDISHNAGKSFHVAPDINVVLGKSAKMGFTLYAGGGEWVNTLSSLYDHVTPYMSPYFTYSFSHIPFVLGLQLRATPFKGFNAGIHGEFAKANDWLMPWMELGSYTMFEPTNISGCKIGAFINYTNGNIFEFNASLDYAPKSRYYLWQDRANFVVTGSMIVTPINPLDITISYQLRSGRHIDGSGYDVPLGNISNLDAGITWRFNDRFSAFINMENVLNNNYLAIGIVPCRGLGGLAGISYKF